MKEKKIDNSLENTRNKLNANYSEDRIVNNKQMRLSKLQKWILTNVREKPLDDAKLLTQKIEGFSPNAYFYLTRREIMKGYFSESYTKSLYWDGRKIDGFDSIIKSKKASAEAALSRSLKTLEEYGWIIRVRLWHMPLKQAEIMYCVMHGKSDEEVKEAIEKINGKSEFGWFKRVKDFGTVTQGIFLTDKGIDLRNKLSEDG